VKKDCQDKYPFDKVSLRVGAYMIKRQFYLCIYFISQDGIPRTAYKGVVVFRYNKTRRRIFLIASDSQLGL
jgi:alpha-1,3-mannosyl-glycoprotein beta-1,2-N-acetylglucosaminyltransferase